VRYPVFDQLEQTLLQYRKRLSGADSDIRELIAAVDFHVRIAYTLVIAASRVGRNAGIRVAPMPGFGTMFAIVSAKSVAALASGDILRDRVKQLAAKARSEVDAFKVPKRYASFKTMRDQLSHGHPLPSDQEVVATTLASLVALETTLTANLRASLADVFVILEGDQMRLDIAGHFMDLMSLWQQRVDGCGIEVYSHFANEDIWYITPSGELAASSMPTVVNRFIDEVLIDRKGMGGEVARFVKELLADISAFTEDYSPPSYYFGDEEELGHIFVPWTRSTSDENQPRIDSFRIGPDGRKEWNDIAAKCWVPYSDFLRTISNWQVLARRIGIGLEAFANARNHEEATRLGGSSTNEVRGPANLREKLEDLSGERRDAHFPLVQRVDESCQSIKPSTIVYFLVGQAGLGKTDLMLSLARTRAAEIASQPVSGKPLYLFVSSTGRTLASLDDAVNSALNITKLLSSHSARALCRNGLLVLFVDGFDELLGSSGYENALGSLEPWFRELGGRGVLVASARSSYYLTQYRRSLANHANLNVDHTLIEVQPWTRSEAADYLRERGVPASALARIRERDWAILGVPFFAKAFSAWFDKTQHDLAPPRIFDIVVDQYMDRESSKLRDPINGELLTPSELKNLFSEAAEIMQLTQSRELEQADMVLCAQQVVGEEALDKVRPGLTRRLSSLCGLGVSTDSSGNNQFSFSHEVLFDCFLSAALQAHLGGAAAFSYRAVLEQSNVNPAVFEWLLDKRDDAMQILPAQLEFDNLQKNTGRVISENLGALWCSMLAKLEGVPPTNRVSGLRLDEVRLAAKGWTSLTLDKCGIAALDLPADGEFRVVLQECEIDYLKCESAHQLKYSVAGIDSCKIRSVQLEGEYGDDPARVREVLQAFGLIPRTLLTGDSQFVDAAEFFLEKMAKRPDVPIIVTRDGKAVDPEDQRLSWAVKFGDESWRAFVDLLVDCSLGRWDSITSSGRAKVRLALNTSPSVILSREGSHEIERFWTQLASA